MGLVTQTQQDYYNNGVYGDYQFTSLQDIINQFIIAYVGEEKIISKVKRTDVVFHAQRALQELSFDTFKSTKSQEITVPSNLSAKLPIDYVNYVKLSWSDSAGIKHTIYPTKYTSNPERFLQNEDGDFNVKAIGNVKNNDLEVVLNDLYDNIVIGMNVSGYGIPEGTVVRAIKTKNKITTITLSNSPVTNSNTGLDQTLFFNFENLYKEPDFKLSQHYAGYGPSLPKQITFFNIDTSTNIDMEDSGVKIGMNVISEDFPVGTKVVDIVNNIVFVSNDPIRTAVPMYDTTILFTSDKSTSQTLKNYQSYTPSDNTNRYDDGTYDLVVGERYGLNPEQAQVNGTFYISNGYIYFSSNISGKNVIIDYISDGLGTDEEMQVHKFAEEAMYKYIAHAVLATKANVPEYLVNRYKKEKFAAIRQAKLRLSNIKLEEITQVLRNKSKWIKH